MRSSSTRYLARFVWRAPALRLTLHYLLDREYVASRFQTYGCFWGAELRVAATGNLPFTFWARPPVLLLAAMVKPIFIPDTTFALRSVACVPGRTLYTLSR